MNVQEFIEKNLSNAKFDRDFNRYLYLKERLEKQQHIISSEEGGEIFNEFLALKDKLFDLAMHRFLRHREIEDSRNIDK